MEEISKFLLVKLDDVGDLTHKISVTFTLREVRASAFSLAQGDLRGF